MLVDFYFFIFHPSLDFDVIWRNGTEVVPYKYVGAIHESPENGQRARAVPMIEYTNYNFSLNYKKALIRRTGLFCKTSVTALNDFRNFHDRSRGRRRYAPFPHAYGRDGYNVHRD